MKIKQTDKTIFLVDDVVENLQLLTKMLTESGYRIRAAKTGKEAIASIQTEIPDLILLDVKLPDINGFEVCRLLKEDKRTHHVPVVFLSGLSDTADKLEGFSAGGVDYITKPFISEEVLIRVNTHIEMSSLRLELENVALNLKEKNKLLEEEAAERKLAAERLSESYRKLEDSQKTTVSILSDLQQEMNLRLKQEEALRQSEERFQLLFYKTNLCYQTLDSGGNILDVNSQWLDTFGFERDEVVGKWFGNFIAPEYLSCLKEHFASFKAHGHVQRDFEIMHKDGRSFFVTLEGSIECDFNGHFKQTHCVLQDVAESKRVNELLRRNREDFKELFDRAPVGYHELDAEGRIVRINETELEMLGYSLSEIVGEYLWKFAVNETVSYRSITSKLAGKPGKTDSYERDYIRKDGRIISVLVTDKILKTDDGKIIGIRSNVQDITEQKLVQKALLKSQSLFSQAFNGSPAPMTIASQPDGKYIEVNESFLRLTEYSHDEVIGKTGDSLNLIDSAESAKIFNHLKKTGYLHNVEVFARSKSGKTLRLLTSIENTELAGEACTLSTMLDITERVMAEEALRKSQIQHRAIIHTAMDGFWLVDKNGKILEANDSYSKMSKYSIQELLQMSVSDLEAIEKQEDIEQRIKRILDNGSDRFETRHKRKDGSLFDLEVSIQKQGDSDNVVAFFHDITARKQADDALRKSEEKFKKAFMTTPDCVNINRLEDGMYVALNPGFTNIIGYTEQEILGKTSLEKSIWYDVADRKRWVAELNANGEIRNFETQFRTKNGNVIDGLVSASIIELDGVKHVISITRDITERKTVEKTLKESEEKFRNIFEYSIVGKSITSFDGKLSVNKAFSNIVGYSEKELSKLTWRDITYEDDIELKEKEIELLVKGVKKFTKFESRFVHKNGNIVWTDLSAVLQKDNDGKPLYFITSINDITERKLAEFALQESRARLDAALASMTDAVFISDHEGNFIEFNDAFVSFHRFKDKAESTRVYSKYPDILEVCYPDGEPAPADMWAVPRALRGEIATNAEYILRRKDTGETWFGSYSFSPIRGAEGEIVGSVVVGRDITEKKLAENKLRESEEKLSALFSSMTEIVVMHELVFNEENEAIDYRIIDCNNAFTQLMGIRKEDAIGRLGTEVYGIETPSYFEIYVQVATTGKAYEYDSYYVPKDKHFIVSVVSPRKNVFATITTDISTIKQIQDEITAKNQELENYLYIASHDLRSPLVNIQGFSQRLQKQSNEIKSLLSECKIEDEKRESFDRITNEAIPKTLNFILSNVLKMDSLISSLLQISRTGRLPLTVKRVDMNELIKTIIAAQNYQLTELSAQVVVHELSDCFGDENQLNQLFSNIIDNAIKYRNKERQLVIEIGSKIAFSKVIYSLKDSGKGITPRNMEKIWDVFYRVDSTSEKGEGIGLSIAKTITNKHKGKIWVESEENKGSTFYVELQLNEFSDQ